MLVAEAIHGNGVNALRAMWRSHQFTHAHVLSEDRTMASKYEREFKKGLLGALRDSGIEALYEPIRLPVPNAGYGMTLDFFLHNGYVNGQPVVIEPHGAPLVTVPYLEDLKAVSDTFGLHIVFATNEPVIELNARLGVNALDYVGKYWNVRARRDVIGMLVTGLLTETERGESCIPALREQIRH